MTVRVFGRTGACSTIVFSNSKASFLHLSFVLRLGRNLSSLKLFEYCIFCSLTFPPADKLLFQISKCQLTKLMSMQKS